jgi:ankyrin repeat protein
MSINRNRQDEDGNTMFHLMVIEDRYEALTEVIRQYFLKFPHGKQSLAALIGKKNYVERGGSRTALHYAQSAKCVQLLVKNGATVDVQDTFGLTPLHIYILENRMDCLHAILSLGASVNISCKKSFNFTSNNSKKKVAAKKSTNKNKKSDVKLKMGLHGRSSLMLAAQCANYDALLLLLNYSSKKALSQALALSFHTDDRGHTLTYDDGSGGSSRGGVGGSGSGRSQSTADNTRSSSSSSGVGGRENVAANRATAPAGGYCYPPDGGNGGYNYPLPAAATAESKKGAESKKARTFSGEGGKLTPSSQLQQQQFMKQPPVSTTDTTTTNHGPTDFSLTHLGRGSGGVLAAPTLDNRRHTDTEGNTCLHLVCACTSISRTISKADRKRVRILFYFLPSFLSPLFSIYCCLLALSDTT